MSEVLIGKIPEIPLPPPSPSTSKKESPSQEVAPPKETAPKDNRPKATFNLSNIGKVMPTTVEKPVANGTERTPDRPILRETLDAAWTEFAEKRKHQIAEYQILRNGYELKGTQIHLTLANAFEEPLLQGILTSLIAFLRERLGNSSLMVIGVLKETEVKKGVYGNKGKFEKMAEENPVLNDLKERFGLDLDS